jgi:hypothetical protein
LPRQIRVNIKWKEKKGESEIVLPALVSIPAHLYDDKSKVFLKVPLKPPTSTKTSTK